MRAIYLRERVLPTYHDLAAHYDKMWGAFDFDHRAPSRGKYRVHAGVRVYEGGFVEVEPYVYGNPDLRRLLARMYNLIFLPTKECYGVKFFTPDNVPVATSAITTGMLFLDGQTQRAYSYESHWRCKGGMNEQAMITFAAPGAVPVAHAQVHVDLPDPARVKAVLREHKEFFKACEMTAKLLKGTDVHTTVGRVSGPTNIALVRILQCETMDWSTIPLEAQVGIGEYVAGRCDVGIRARLTALSARNYTFPYLKIVMGAGHG